METQARRFGRCISNLLISTVIFTSTALANPMLQPWEDRSGYRTGLLLEPRVSFYSTHENYSSTGAKTPIIFDGSASRTYYDVFGIYGLSDDFFLFGRLSVLTTNITSTFMQGGSSNVTALSDQMLGGALRIWRSESGSSQTIQLETIIPAYSNSNSRANNTAYLGDGSLDFTLGSFVDLALPIQETYFSVGAGFTKRSAGYSSAIPWNAFLKHDPAQGIFIAGGVRGQVSLKSDEATDNAVLLSQVTVDQNRGSGGSFLTNAVNPEWMVAELTGGYRISSGHLFYLRGGLPLSGTNAPSGTQVSVGVQFDFTDGAGERTATAKPARQANESDIKGFATYNLSGKVTSTNDQLYLFKIDKGTSAGIEKGQIFDVFQIQEDDLTHIKKEKRIARAKVSYVKDDESALSVLEYFVDSWIEVGFTAKRIVK